MSQDSLSRVLYLFESSLCVCVIAIKDSSLLQSSNFFPVKSCWLWKLAGSRLIITDGWKTVAAGMYSPGGASHSSVSVVGVAQRSARGRTHCLVQSIIIIIIGRSRSAAGCSRVLRLSVSRLGVN